MLPYTWIKSGGQQFNNQYYVDWTEFKSHRRSRGAELQKESMTEALMCEVWKKKTEKEKDVPD